MSSNEVSNYYRPQRSCGQGYVFTCVCHSVNTGGVCLSACWYTTSPPQEQTPPGSRHSPWSRHPPEQTPRSKQPPPGSRHPPGKQTPIREQTPPPFPEADSMSGRYASYCCRYSCSLAHPAAAVFSHCELPHSTGIPCSRLSH